MRVDLYQFHKYLLVDHLAGSGKIERGVALTIGTGSLVEKVATFHGLPVERHPVGFKHLSAAIASGRVDLAGEESGGFALASSGRDKDGILVGCLLTNLVATSGENLEVHVMIWEEKVISVELPVKIDMKVVETMAVDKGNTATNATKDATLEGGYVAQVPMFVNTGDTVRIDTRDGSYESRV